MILAHDAAQVRAAEAPLLAAGVPLMDRAAFALAAAVGRELRARRGRVVGSRAVLLAGSGNNGGDTLYAGALLAARGVAVLAVATSAQVHAAGLDALHRAGGLTVSLVAGGPGPLVGQAEAVTAALAADVLLDGLLGIGARGALRGAAGRLVQALVPALAGHGPAGRRPLVVAVDVPSGIDVDTGALPGVVLPAALTVTFGTAKPGLLLPPADRPAGRVQVVELGLPLVPEEARAGRLADADVAALWPVPPWEAQKYTRGVLGVVAGTLAYPGAAVLTVTAAVRAGVGMVRYLGPEPVAAAVLAARPEVVVGPGRVQAWVVGPGVAPDDAEQAARVRAALAQALAEGIPVVADAGALGLLPDRLPPSVVLTPHAGELATLLSGRGEPVDRAGVEGEPARWARRAHELTGATVLLKGATTVVAGEGGTVWAQADAPAWLATAGAGDVLSGLLGAVLAGRSGDVGADPALVGRLAAMAALVHGRAAGTACPGGPVAALDVAAAIPATVARLLA